MGSSGISDIRIINCFDTINKSVFSDFVARLLRGDTVYWNDDDNKRASRVEPANNTFVLNASKLTANDVLVLDSWTAIVWSTTVNMADEKDIDLSDAAKLEWE